MDHHELTRVAEEVLEEWAIFVSRNGHQNSEKVVDKAVNRYLLMQEGWVGWKRIYGPVFDVSIRDGKIWINQDNTEEGIPDDLLKRGVPPEQIVLGWQHPKKREITEFAVA